MISWNDKLMLKIELRHKLSELSNMVSLVVACKITSMYEDMTRNSLFDEFLNLMVPAMSIRNSVDLDGLVIHIEYSISNC